MSSSIADIRAKIDMGLREHERPAFHLGFSFSEEIDVPLDGVEGTSMFDEVDARVCEYKEQHPKDWVNPKLAAFKLGIFANVAAQVETRSLEELAQVELTRGYGGTDAEEDQEIRL